MTQHTLSPIRYALLLALLAFASPAFAQSPTTPVIQVNPNGKAQFKTLQEAIDHAPATGAIISIAPGTYHEKVFIHTPEITLIGTGHHPQDTVITWGDSAQNTGSTFKSGTITVVANGFEAENLSIVNTWWDDHTTLKDHSQAVALQMDSDRAVLDNVRIISAQDTLYAASNACRGDLNAPCRADRQFFHDCFIQGNVDYIFGDAKAVFQNCEFHSRPGWGVMVTAQSRHSMLEDSGYYMLHCTISGNNDGAKVFLGRPWRDFATVLFYDTNMKQSINPAGWDEWAGRLKTAKYSEYKSHGSGANLGHRDVQSPSLTQAQEKALTPEAILAGGDWSPEVALKNLQEDLHRLK